MFFWEGGLKLARCRLAVDFPRRQACAFVSHAHADHMARHGLALCTPATAALYQARLGRRPVIEMPYLQPIEWGGLRLTTYPAGHCLGSAMLLAQDGERSLLYTGDFKLGPSATAEPAELPHADLLVMETTYGRPEYRLPPREEAVAQLLEVARAAIASGRTPVVVAYPLGKAQEVTRLLTAAGIPVAQHRAIRPISRVYERFGVDLGEHALLEDRPPPGWAAVVPPRTPLYPWPGEVRIAVTGWAVEPGAKARFGVDHAIPLSDHADYDGLLEAVSRVAPKRVYCTHGPESFVDRLREAGFDACALGPASRRGMG